VIFIRTFTLGIRTEISDFHRVIPYPNRNTRKQPGARKFYNLEADLRMNLFLAACSDIKIREYSLLQCAERKNY